MNNKGQDIRTVAKLTNAEAHHFFIINVMENDGIGDEDGYVMVFLSKEAAAQVLVSLVKAKPGTPLMIAGMGDEKWARFEKDVPHRIVPLACA
jgi:hypothetical protein